MSATLVGAALIEVIRNSLGLLGINAGAVVAQEGDYFGRTVNVAARIAGYARPGEVLVSQEVVDASEEMPLSFTEIGPVDLKGISGSLQLHTAHRKA